MNTLTFISVAVALLASAGWLIGWQVARASRQVDAAPITIVANRALHQPLLTALSRLGEEPYRYNLLDEAPSDDGRGVYVTKHTDSTAVCRGTQQTPSSYALQRISMARPPSPEDWTSVACTALYQLNEQDMQVRSLRSESERIPARDAEYRIAWCAMRQGDQQSLREAHRALSEIVTRWPDTRLQEKSGILANLAEVCHRLEEDPQHHLARLLQGLDAAQEALELQYLMAERHRISGLRPLIRQLRDAVHAHDKAATPTGDPGDQSRTNVRRARAQVLQSSEAFVIADCPQPNALVGHDTGVPVRSNLL